MTPGGAPVRPGVGATLRSLQRALRAEIHLHRELERRAAQVRDAVVCRDVPALREATAAQSAALGALGGVSGQVREALAAAAALLGEPEAADIRALGEALGRRGLAAEAAALEALRAEVVAAAGRAHRASAECAPLLRQALAFTGFVLSLLVAPGPGAPYTPDGHAGLSRRALLDARL